VVFRPFWPICSVNKAANRLQNLRIRYNQCQIFTVAYYRDIALMQEMLSFIGAVAVVMPTSSSKTAHQHIMHVRQLSYCSMKLRSSSIRTCGCPIVPILILFNNHIWGVMRDRVCQTSIQDVADLRQCLLDTWSGFSQSIVDDAIDKWRKRLQA